jgi:hypothetical protein
VLSSSSRCTERASGLARLGVEETKEKEKTREDGFGSFSRAECFSIMEEYSFSVISPLSTASTKHG